MLDNAEKVAEDRPARLRPLISIAVQHCMAAKLSRRKPNPFDAHALSRQTSAGRHPSLLGPQRKDLPDYSPKLYMIIPAG